MRDFSLSMSNALPATFATQMIMQALASIEVIKVGIIPQHIFSGLGIEPVSWMEHMSNTFEDSKTRLVSKSDPV